MKKIFHFIFITLLVTSCSEGLSQIERDISDSSFAVKSTDSELVTTAHKAGYVVGLKSARFYAESTFPDDVIVSEEYMKEEADTLFYLQDIFIYLSMDSDR